MIDIIFFIIGAWFCMALGAYCQYRTSIDYHKRWKNCIELLKQEQINTGELGYLEQERSRHGDSYHESEFIDPPIVEDLERIYPVYDLRSQNDGNRVDVELDRAEKGMPPADDLSDLKGRTVVAKIMKLRQQHGWDWKGQYWEYRQPPRSWHGRLDMLASGIHTPNEKDKQLARVVKEQMK